MSIDPIFIDLPVNVWTVIDRKVNSVKLNKISNASSAYYYIYLEAGSPPPVNGDTSQATLAFQDLRLKQIEVAEPIDIYMLTTGKPGRISYENIIATDVFIQDQHSTIVDLHLHEHGIDLTLAINTVLGSKIITLEPGHGLAFGNFISFEEVGRCYEGQVIAVAVDDITLDSPLDFAFTIAANLHESKPDLNVNGLVTPVVFHNGPASGCKWDITRMIFLIESTQIMDSSKFGSLDALINGIVVRKKDGTFKNIFNVKTNGEFALRSFDVVYDDRAPAGTFGFRVRTTFAGQSKRGVTIRLDGNLGDELETLVQDDLTGLSKFRIIMQGHRVQ